MSGTGAWIVGHERGIEWDQWQNTTQTPFKFANVQNHKSFEELSGTISIDRSKEHKSCTLLAFTSRGLLMQILLYVHRPTIH